jgi:excisionase family DNA binding protein
MAADLPAAAGMTTREVAKLLRVSKDTALAWVKSGALPAVNTATGGGRPRFVVLPEMLAEFLRRHRAGPAPVAARRRKRTAAIDFFPD